MLGCRRWRILPSHRLLGRCHMRIASPTQSVESDAARRKDWLSVRKEALVSVRRGARSARDPTAPSASTDPGLVLVRGSDRPSLRNDRKGWIMSVKLTDAQLVMMSAAAQRDDRCLAAPETMKGSVMSKASAKLVKLGLVREIRAKAGMPIWRRDDTGQGHALKLTAAGLKAIAFEEGSQEAIESTQPRAHAEALAPRDGSKMARLVELLQRSHGATILHLTEATGWLPHTTRAALTGLRKRGYVVVRERVGAGGSIYRISGVAGCGERLVIQGDAADDRDGVPTPKAGQAA
jgi:uncharacterized protein DUF3489